MQVISQPDSELIEAVEAVIQAARDGRSLLLSTSGTTGVPKTVERSMLSALEGKRVGNNTERWLLTYSPRRWAGVSVILHTFKAGATLVVPRSLAFRDIVQAGSAHGATHISLTPSMFRNLLLNDPQGLVPALPIKQVTFGGEAAPQSVLDLAVRAWPQARVSHVYASTEFGDICAVSDRKEGVPAHKFAACSFTNEGELMIKGIPTGDLWTLRGGRYYFTGRVEEIINVGGNKVSPLAVEEFAIACGARVARAYAVPSGLMGSLVGLDYIGEIEKQDLLKLFRAQLPKDMCPVQVARVAEIALSPAGKNRRLS